MNGFYRYFRISKPSAERVPEEKVDSTYRRLRSQTFWGVTVAYSLFYVCRMTLSIVKQPLIDGGIFNTGQLGLIGSALLFVYAVGKFINGFIADYCNIRRFMAIGLFISALVNLIIGILGFATDWIRISPAVMFLTFAVLWGINGWMQSMGSPPGVISLSRWFPLKERGTWYSIFSATPYLGKSLSFWLIGIVVGWFGWQYGFIFASVAGFAGALLVAFSVSDTPESKGLPSIQELNRENREKTDSMPTKVLQKYVFKNPGIWVIALSSAFVYITQYAVSGWGVLFLQKSKGFSDISATDIIAFSEIFGIAGTVCAGWLSDKLFRGDRIRPVILSGVVCLVSLWLFLFTGGSALMNIIYVSTFSISIGVVFCVVAGLMALDIVPRKATGSALGIVGISSYVAAGIQDIVSGFMIRQDASGAWDFGPVSWFWIVACLVSFILPVYGWKYLKKKVVQD
ncbi:MAG: MFS transporter [Bacteroidales bacterium]|nr:MFS transporter [Bacteroidales bacterium]MBR4409288.1 MFS transporter [Bacteroidales bacterium]